MVIEQIKAQLARLVPVYDVHDLTMEGPHVGREMALVKIRNGGEKRIEALRIADTFRARAIDSTLGSFVFELTGDTGKIDAFIDLMISLGEVEVSRTGCRRHRPGRTRAHAAGPQGQAEGEESRRRLTLD